MGKSRFVELMAKSMAKSASKAELAELQLFLTQHPEHNKTKHITDALNAGLKQGNGYDETQIENKLDALWVKIRAAEQQPEIKKIVRWQWLASAAAVILIMLIGVQVYKNYFISKPKQLTGFNIITVPLGKTMQVKLADGTAVKLNAGSRLSYPSVFLGNKREVNLEGEGFFEVTKNPEKPFLVHTKAFTIKVLGTVFNVKVYPGDKKTETTLLKGKVQVELNADPEKQIFLLPRQKLVVNAHPVLHQNSLVDKKAQISDYQIVALPKPVNNLYLESAWTQDKIIFTNEAFGEVAKQLERKYNVVFAFKNDELRHEQISGILQNESLERVLDILKQIVDFNYTVAGHTVFIEQKSKQKP